VTKEKELKKSSIRTVSVKRIKNNPWNPNELTDIEQELLDDNISAIDFSAPILVRPYQDKKNKKIRYQVVDGEHRLAAAIREGIKKIPVVVRDLTDAQAMKQTVRMNKIRGTLNHDKFNKLVDKLIDSGDMLLDDAPFELGFAEQEEFLLIRETMRETLPNEEAKKEFDKRVKEAKSVDDIYSLVMALIKKYGDSLPANWMVISIGQGRGLWVKLEGHLLKQFEKIARTCMDEGVTFDSYIVAALGETKDATKYIKKHRVDLDEIEDDSATSIDDLYIDSEEAFDEAAETA
jgi:ParB/RepB/Spo0J family partition protein